MFERFRPCFLGKLAAAVVAVLISFSAGAAVRVWSQVNGVWSTNPADTPFTGRSFNNGDVVIFTDPENLTQEMLTAHVTVSGTVIPQTITFTNAVTMYITTNGSPDASIGKNEDVGRVQFVNKFGLAPVTVDTPICFKNVLVADGVLTLNAMDSLANTVHVKENATFNFRHTGDIDERVFASYTLDENATWHRLGLSKFHNLYFPTDGSTYAPGSRTLFDSLEVTGFMRVFSPDIYLGVTESAKLERLEVWNGAEFVVTGHNDPSETNTIDHIDVLCNGRVNLLHGYFTVGTLTTNSTIAAMVAAGASDRGRLVIGGNRRDPIPTYFNYVNPPGIVYTENNIIGNTYAQMPALTVGGLPEVNSYLFVTNGAKLTVNGKMIMGGGDATNRIRRVFVGDGADVTVNGQIDFSSLTNYQGQADARLMVSNAILRTSGIDFGPKDLINKVRQVVIADNALLELGANNSRVNIAATNITTIGLDSPRQELGPSYAGTNDQCRSFIIDGATLRFTEDQMFNHTIFLQELRTNVIDLAGHTVSNCASVNPYYAGLTNSVNSDKTFTCCRLEIRDSSPEQNGFFYIDSPHWSVRNGVVKTKSAPADYVRKQYGTQVMSGRLRMKPRKGEDCGFSLRGGILELPVGTDYPDFVKESYVDLCDATSALACIWDSEVGAIIRCYCSDKTKLITRDTTNKWQLVCEVVSKNPNSFYDGIAIDEFMRKTVFQLIDESTGEMLPGATFVAWPLQKMAAQSVYDEWKTYTQMTNKFANGEISIEPIKPKHPRPSNNGWWYTNESSTNRYAILMRYETDIATVTDLYWAGGAGPKTLSDDNTDDWLKQDGEEHRYGDGANVYITNLTEKLTLVVDRSTAFAIEQIELDEAGNPVVGQDGNVVTNIYSSGYAGHKPASPKTLNVFDCEDVFLNAQGTVIATSGVLVTNSVVTVDGYLIVDGGVEVIGQDAMLTATQLVHRSSWYVSPGATFHAGYDDPEVWFSTMSHTITNYGTITYNLNGRTEHITQQLTYPEDATDEDTCYYTFVNGVLEFYGMDYLTRRANTNVWISTGCTRHIMGEAGVWIQAAPSLSPLGYEKGGSLLVDAPYISKRGSVLRSQAHFELNDTFAWVPGASFTVIEHQEGWDGEIKISGTGEINFMDNYEGRSFATEPFYFRIHEGETNRVEVPLTGSANIVVDGGGTLTLADCPSTLEGTLTVKAPSVLMVEGPESLGYLDVIVEDGAYINFKAEGRPQKYCRSITMQKGSTISLGPDSSTIEPQNPIRILELGKLSMPSRGVDALTRFNDTSIEDSLNTEYGIRNVAAQQDPSMTLRFYDYARAFQGQYVELFGLLGELVWDMDTPEGIWFSRKSGVPDITDAKWHEAKEADPLDGYDTSIAYPEWVKNFQNSQRNSVTFLSPAVVTVNNWRFVRDDYADEISAASATSDLADEGDGDSETDGSSDDDNDDEHASVDTNTPRLENRLLPSGIIFATPPGTVLVKDSPAGSTAAGEIKIIGSADDSVIGSADDSVIGSAEKLTSVLATRGTDAILNVPIWLRNITVEKNSYLRIRELMDEPELTVVEKGSHFAFGAKYSGFTWEIDRFRGEGRVDKIGDKNVVFNITADDLFPHPLGVREGELKVESATEIPTVFTGGLFLTRYEESISRAPLTLFNTAGKYGWVFDGTANKYNVEVDDEAVICGRTFGIVGNIDVSIAPGKTFHIEAPIAEYVKEDEDVYSHVDIHGGTIRFSESLTPSDEYDRTTLMDITSAADNRVELNGKCLYARNILFDGTLAAIHNGDDINLVEEIINKYEKFDKVFRIDLPGATNETALINFPLPVRLNTVKVPKDPRYVFAFDSNGNEIPCEKDSYAENGTANDSGLLVWVKVPELDKNTHLYIAIVFESDLSNLELTKIDSAKVWDDYIAVWHMNVKPDGTLYESTTNHWKTTYYCSHANMDLSDGRYEKWYGSGGPLGNSFRFNDRYSSSVANEYNGFAVTNGMIKFMSEMSLADRTGVSTEGFFEVLPDGKRAYEYQKILSYRVPGEGFYNFGWYSAQSGSLWGSFIAYVTGDNSKTRAVLRNFEKTPLQAPTNTWYYAGATLVNRDDDGVGQVLWQGDQNNYFKAYTSGDNATTSRAKSIVLGKAIYDTSSAAKFGAHVGIGCRFDIDPTDSTTGKLADILNQSWVGCMSELRIRKGSAPVSQLWVDTVRRSAMMNKLFTQVSDVSPDLFNQIKVTESVAFNKGSVIEIQPGCIQDKALLVDLTTISEDGTEARFVTSADDASVTIDLSTFGKLTDDMNGSTLIKVRGEAPINVFNFKLKLSEENENPQEWALRTVRYHDETTASGQGTLIQLVKAQGAVMVVSPAPSGAEWPAKGDVPDFTARDFASNGTDFAYIPDNYNAGTNLHSGAVIRDSFAGRTDGVTTEQVNSELTNDATPNTAYWFWFEGDNGAWTETKNYTLNLDDEKGNLDDTPCYVQFAVTNQIFYGQATDTLNSGELGFYVSWDDDGTNLVARVLNTTKKVMFSLDNVTHPWLVVTVEVKPYEGYKIMFNGQEKFLSTTDAERPRQLRITGIAPVDNLFVSNGNPNRETLVYVHDMTQVGVDGEGGPIWADAPIDTSEEYLERILKKAREKGFTYEPPTIGRQSIQPLGVAFHCRVRRGGVVYDSDVAGNQMFYESGNDHLERIDIMQIPVTVAEETIPTISKEYGALPAYLYNYEYALGIKKVQLHSNNAVSIFSVLSDSAESYDDEHLMGSVEKGSHKVNGYLMIEATESDAPYVDRNAKWRIVSVSALSQFGTDHLNETFVAVPNVKSNMTYRVRIQRDYPISALSLELPEE